MEGDEDGERPSLDRGGLGIMQAITTTCTSVVQQPRADRRGAGRPPSEGHTTLLLLLSSFHDRRGMDVEGRGRGKDCCSHPPRPPLARGQRIPPSTAPLFTPASVSPRGLPSLPPFSPSGVEREDRGSSINNLLLSLPRQVDVIQPKKGGREKGKRPRDEACPLPPSTKRRRCALATLLFSTTTLPWLPLPAVGKAGYGRSAPLCHCAPSYRLRTYSCSERVLVGHLVCIFRSAVVIGKRDGGGGRMNERRNGE